VFRVLHRRWIHISGTPTSVPGDHAQERRTLFLELPAVATHDFLAASRPSFETVRERLEHARPESANA
jgi:hypothetical protein